MLGLLSKTMSYWLPPTNTEVCLLYACVSFPLHFLTFSQLHMGKGRVQPLEESPAHCWTISEHLGGGCYHAQGAELGHILKMSWYSTPSNLSATNNPPFSTPMPYKMRPQGLFRPINWNWILSDGKTSADKTIKTAHIPYLRHATCVLRSWCEAAPKENFKLQSNQWQLFEINW